MDKMAILRCVRHHNMRLSNVSDAEECIVHSGTAQSFAREGIVEIQEHTSRGRHARYMVCTPHGRAVIDALIASSEGTIPPAWFVATLGKEELSALMEHHSVEWPFGSDSPSMLRAALNRARDAREKTPSVQPTMETPAKDVAKTASVHRRRPTCGDRVPEPYVEPRVDTSAPQRVVPKVTIDPRHFDAPIETPAKELIHTMAECKRGYAPVEDPETGEVTLRYVGIRRYLWLYPMETHAKASYLRAWRVFQYRRKGQETTYTVSAEMCHPTWEHRCAQPTDTWRWERWLPYSLSESELVQWVAKMVGDHAYAKDIVARYVESQPGQ